MKIKVFSLYKNIIWIVKEINSFNKMYPFLLGINSLFQAVLPVFALVITQMLIDTIQRRIVHYKYVIVLVLLLVITQMITDVVLPYITLWINNFELKFEVYTQAKLLKKVAKLKSKDFESSTIYDLIVRTQYDMNAGVIGNAKLIFDVFSVLISAISYVVVLFKYSVIMIGIIIFISLFRYLYEKKYNILEYNTIKENTSKERRASYIFQLLTNSEYIKELRIYDLFEYFIEKFKKNKENCKKKLISLHSKRTYVFSWIAIIEIAVDTAILVNMIRDIILGNILLGKFVLYNSSVNNLKQNTISLFSRISLFYKNNEIINQLRGFFELSEEHICLMGERIEKIRDIELVNVSYKYKPDRPYVLKDISLKITANTQLVIMGENGAGKTSLVKIIMGLYDDYEGEIYVNGINLKKINLKNYREKVGVLFQDYIKYESTIENNIYYGDLNRFGHKDELNQILKKIKMDKYINNSAQKLGYQFEGGEQISIGQWQKLALGRCLFSNADVLIFDEPNASLDLSSEKEILTALQEKSEEHISIFIMHRFNPVVLHANKIIVLEKGSIVENGNHQELIEGRGRYYDLYTIYSEFNSLNKGNNCDDLGSYIR
ncbi:ABC transporter, ATP-binding protein [Lachnoanaerobaculum saburreum F0468]|jgi:subtilin transport ATP-binding protein spaT|uniref:ABC transporter, ATP-binding protein n=2 Tax=Lachnoanaerobaculum saburreum TaxID=467210 RepID=I0R9D1_9FIRM|nr:ABC transporter ATP-binding protein [Lachnoanaerobaculum saburreum]EIC96289.1 ABC transporter, ATP-binding protein [Lachnoanaerobaculum saburreum F0468]